MCSEGSVVAQLLLTTLPPQTAAVQQQLLFAAAVALMNDAQLPDINGAVAPVQPNVAVLDTASGTGACATLQRAPTVNWIFGNKIHGDSENRFKSTS